MLSEAAATQARGNEEIAATLKSSQSLGNVLNSAQWYFQMSHLKMRVKAFGGEKFGAAINTC